MSDSNGFESSITPAELANEIDPSPIVRKLKSDNRQLLNRINELKLQIGDQQDLFFELAQVTPTIVQPKISYSEPDIPKISSKMSLAVVLSDWHIGEYIEPDEIEGINQFSWDIATRRVKYLSGKILDWIQLNRTISIIDEVVIICVGDFISGDIHEELSFTNEFPVPEQIIRAGSLIAEFVSVLSGHFPTVRVEFITADNHSRITKKYQFKEGGLNSFDYIVGWIAQEKLKSHSNVEFKLHNTFKTIVPVRGYNYLCQHGHTIKGWSGFPYYGIDRQASKEAKSRMFQLDRQFHKMVLGHFHAPLNAPYWMINGSLPGTSELDHACGRFSNPCQIAWLVHPKFGEWSWNTFWLQLADKK